jgi:hypothetical protein
MAYNKLFSIASLVAIVQMVAIAKAFTTPSSYHFITNSRYTKCSPLRQWVLNTGHLSDQTKIGLINNDPNSIRDTTLTDCDRETSRRSILMKLMITGSIFVNGITNSNRITDALDMDAFINTQVNVFSCTNNIC